ncbi:MAG: hypothetical protein ACLPN6_13890 [Streptosporangiaceae bacterium]|jgi:hypothetical protein|nr:hypothetical protein [Actinomycetota bacterium]
MTDSGNSASRPQLRSGPLITGAALIGAGSLLVLAGLAVGGSHLIVAIRQWVREMEVPPSELARQKWAKAQAAALAGANAWQNGPQASQSSRS